jgi:hypothetical protein
VDGRRRATADDGSFGTEQIASSTAGHSQRGTDVDVLEKI